MCLYLKEGDGVRVARKNILVKKWVRTIKNSNPPQWTPIIMEDTGAYEFNKVIVARSFDNESKLVEIERLRVDSQDTINAGFHSYRLSVNKRYYAIEKFGTRYYAIIPKGSEYAIGCNGDIVSTRIIIFSNLWKYLKWKIQNI